MKSILAKFNISSRIVTLVLVFLALLIITQALNFYQSNQASKDINSITQKDIPMMKQISDITKTQQEQILVFQSALQYGKDISLKQSFLQSQEQFKEMGLQLQTKLKNAIQFGKKSDNSVATQNLEIIKTDYKSYFDNGIQALNLINTNKASQATPLIQSMTGMERNLNNKLRIFLKNIIQKAKESTQLANLQKQFFQTRMYILSIISIIIAVILGFVVTKSITSPLNKGLKIAREIAKGKRNIQFPTESHDEIGQLMSSMNNLFTEICEKEIQLM